MENFVRLLDAGRHRDAASWLVRQHSGEVLGLCRAMLRDVQAAEDATQDVFSRAFANLLGYRGQAAPRTWLLRIAKNRCIDELRRRNARPWDIAEEDVEQVTDSELRDVAESLTNRETVDRALGVLQGPERALVVLRYRHGMSYAELGSAFGVAQGAARMRVSRAIVRMRQHLLQNDTHADLGDKPVRPQNLGAGETFGAPPNLVAGSAAAAPRASAPKRGPAAPRKHSFWQRLFGGASNTPAEAPQTLPKTTPRVAESMAQAPENPLKSRLMLADPQPSSALLARLEQQLPKP